MSPSLSPVQKALHALMHQARGNVLLCAMAGRDQEVQDGPTRTVSYRPLVGRQKGIEPAHGICSRMSKGAPVSEPGSP